MIGRLVKKMHWWSCRPLYEVVTSLRGLLGEERVRSEAAGMLGLEPSARVLDLGCGLGANYLHLVSRAADVVGVEPREEYVEGARALTRERGWMNVRTCHEDLKKLSLETGSVDAVLCTFRLSGMRTFGRILDEAVRVLRPGGVLVVADFMPIQGIWATLVWIVRPLLALCGVDPDRPILEEMDRRIPIEVHRLRFKGLVFLAAARKPGDEKAETPAEAEPASRDLVTAS